MNNKKFRRRSIFYLVIKEWQKELDDPNSVFYRKGRVVLRLLNRSIVSSGTSLICQIAVMMKQKAMEEELFYYTTREIAFILENYQQSVQRAMVELSKRVGINFIVIKIHEMKKAGICIERDRGYGRWVPLPPRTTKEEIKEIYRQYEGIIVKDIPIRGREKGKCMKRKKLQ